MFSQKFFRWNVELDERKILFDIMGTLKMFCVLHENEIGFSPGRNSTRVENATAWLDKDFQPGRTG